MLFFVFYISLPLFEGGVKFGIWSAECGECAVVWARELREERKSEKFAEARGLYSEPVEQIRSGATHPNNKKYN